VESALLYSMKGPVPDDPDFLVPLGQSLVRREGRDLTLVAHSRGVVVALEAAERLAAQGVEAEVVDLRTLRPLDMGPVLASVRKTGRVSSWGTTGKATASEPKSPPGWPRRPSRPCGDPSSGWGAPRCPCRMPPTWSGSPCPRWTG